MDAKVYGSGHVRAKKQVDSISNLILNIHL